MIPNHAGVAWTGDLTNRDLAEVYVTSPKYIANVRARLGVGPASNGMPAVPRTSPSPLISRPWDEREKVKSAGKHVAARESESKLSAVRS